MGQQTHSTGRPPFHPPAGGRRIGGIGGSGSAEEPPEKPLRHFSARCPHVSQTGSRACENGPLSRSISARFNSQPLTWLAKGKRDLAMAGFQPEVTWNDRQAVQVAWIKLPGLHAAAGLSDRPERKLSVRLEIDSRPPEGAICERRIVTRHLTFLTRHLDLPSLMAGKLHALLTRPHVKGRDWFDLAWDLSRRPASPGQGSSARCITPKKRVLSPRFRRRPASFPWEKDGTSEAV